jgi:hypothetical protein
MKIMYLHNFVPVKGTVPQDGFVKMVTFEFDSSSLKGEVRIFLTNFAHPHSVFIFSRLLVKLLARTIGTQLAWPTVNRIVF